jgi:general secretion pathway protein H
MRVAACPDSTCKHVVTRKSHKGFTLLELLVVIVIIGIVISVASVSVNVLGRDNQIEDQAKRLNAVISQAREEAEMQARDTGLFIERDGYLFMRYNYPTRTWNEIEDDELLKRRELPAGLQNRLWLEGREVILKTHAETMKDVKRSASESQSSTSPDSHGNVSKDPRVPQVAILSSGDLSPFELRIEREGADFSWHLVGKPDNSLTVEVTDAPH